MWSGEHPPSFVLPHAIVHLASAEHITDTIMTDITRDMDQEIATQRIAEEIHFDDHVVEECGQPPVDEQDSLELDHAEASEHRQDDQAQANAKPMTLHDELVKARMELVKIHPSAITAATYPAKVWTIVMQSVKDYNAFLEANKEKFKDCQDPLAKPLQLFRQGPWKCGRNASRPFEGCSITINHQVMENDTWVYPYPRIQFGDYKNTYPTRGLSNGMMLERVYPESLRKTITLEQYKAKQLPFAYCRSLSVEVTGDQEMLKFGRLVDEMTVQTFAARSKNFPQNMNHEERVAAARLKLYPCLNTSKDGDRQFLDLSVDLRDEQNKEQMENEPRPINCKTIIRHLSHWDGKNYVEGDVITDIDSLVIGKDDPPFRCIVIVVYTGIQSRGTDKIQSKFEVAKLLICKPSFSAGIDSAAIDYADPDILSKLMDEPASKKMKTE